MSSRPTARATLAALALLAAAVAGCHQSGAFLPFLRNQLPTVEISASPLGAPDTAWYAYDIRWTARDADGSVTRYEYAIDPPTTLAAETTWVATTATSREVWFRATQVEYDPVHGWRANGFHTFVLRAFDDGGAASAVASQAFFAWTIAPKVQITLPRPSALLEAVVPPAARIEWAGEDPDGLGGRKPVQYKYRLIGDGDYDYGIAHTDPDSLRRWHAARGFAGWDSVGGDTTWAEPLRSATPGQRYVFAVIAVDEAGAYSPEFSLHSNLLQLSVSSSQYMGPALTIRGEGLWYTYQSGGVSLDPLAWINLDVPADQPLAFLWSAQTYAGIPVAWYRWRLDGDIADETPRSDERTDWWHWSRKDTLTSARFGPLPGGEEHFLYIEAMDAWGQLSLGIVHFRTVALTGDRSLLVVDDTRLQPDKFPVAGGPPARYLGEWPAAAELDTFLYARGGAPWRGPNGVTGSLPLSTPGVLDGYAFDTLGTRQGYESPSAGVPLGVLGRYRDVLWLTDPAGASSIYGPTSVVNPVSTLRWMSDRGRASTLAAYIGAGGHVWLAGGAAGYATTIAFNANGALNNDNLYGSGKTVFSASAGELVPGRFMYDFAHWRGEFVAQPLASSVVRSAYATGGWVNPGWQCVGTLVAPDYARLPAQLRRRALALGDSLPPTRTGQANTYWTTGPFPVEYLDQDNVIVEDIDCDPLVVQQRSVLDTLYEFRGGAVATTYTGRVPVAMTYYHGVEQPPFVFSGFDLWTWSRQDVTTLVDFVLHDLWGLDRAVPSAAARARLSVPAVSSARPAPAGARTPSGSAARR